MFRQFAGSIPKGANQLFMEHPSVLTAMLEVAWEKRTHYDSPLGDPFHRSNVPQQSATWYGNEQIQKFAAAIEDATTNNGHKGVLWHHLIYAYMIENTRIYEIFRRVLYEFLHGEKFGVPTPAAQHWLRNTEELFYREPPPFSMTTITSQIRPDMRASRRNAYWRMFGMDLNHGTEDGQPYPYVKADAYNNEFVTTLEELLREVWIAIANVNNTSGANPKDRGKIENIVANLQNMLMSRRVNGNLSREEFVAVSTMSWFHLTVQYNFPIIEALKAEASSPEQRLFKIAQRVGLPAHGLSKSYFDVADCLSKALIDIERDDVKIIAKKLVATNSDGKLDPRQELMNTIITHWSVITGRDMKAGKVAVR